VGGFAKTVVVKRILPHLSADEKFIEMFLQEARLAARISHPNVVQIFDVGQVGAVHFIAMEYVKGWDLNAIIRLCMRMGAAFPVGIALRVAADICAGLYAAHTCVDEQGTLTPVLHRDVSPHNVLVSSEGHVKLTDFGIAKALDDGGHTPTATLKGKLSYVSPEQVVADGRPIDSRADLFPVGLMLYQCLTLEHLFRRSTEFETLRAILYDPIPRVSTRRADVPTLVEEVIDRALARNPEFRFGTGLEFQRSLEAAIAETGEPASAADLAAWLRELRHRADKLGHLPPELSFTPTSQQVMEHKIRAAERTGATRTVPPKPRDPTS
jgi:eukaryotic-like serine/threonine-protein kinase